jgi:alpha-tubulin suppressor-like RCC1 family protein
MRGLRLWAVLLFAVGCGRVSIEYDASPSLGGTGGVGSSLAGRATGSEGGRNSRGGHGGHDIGMTGATGGRRQGDDDHGGSGAVADAGTGSGDAGEAGAAEHSAGAAGAKETAGGAGGYAAGTGGTAGHAAGAGTGGTGGTAGTAGTGTGAGGSAGSTTANVRVLSGSARTVCSLMNGQVKCWGAGYYGTLGNEAYGNKGDQPNELGPQLKPVNVGTGLLVQAISVSNHACAIVSSGALKCWGWNNHGELGLDDTITRGALAGQMGDALKFVNLGVGRSALQISANSAHTCALLDDHGVKCWGVNFDGELGYDDTLPRGGAAGDMAKLAPLALGKSVLAVYAGSSRSCAILIDGSLKCWGKNEQGQLGYGDTLSRGSASGDMAALPTVSLGVGRTVKQLVMGQQFNCALLDDQSVKCWGRGHEGQLASGSPNAIGDQPGEMGDALQKVKLGARLAVALTAGKNHACALLDDGKVKCWGSAENGQLGNDDATQWSYVGDNPNELGDNLKPVALGAGHTATAIAAGEQSTCVVLEDRTSVKCWGNGFDGELGNGNTGIIGDQPGEMGDALPVVPLE